MPRLKITSMRRAARLSGLAARTPKEAAVHLVRLEFDRSRIEFGLRQAEDRADCLRAEGAALDRRRRSLLAILNS
jgi:hypothetical protein